MTPPSPSRPVEILLVEDSAADAHLMLEFLRGARTPNAVTVARDGVEALAMLRREGAYRSYRCPDMIVLDLNLPRKDGRRVLAELKQHPELRAIPVVVLTTSAAEEDVRRCYDLQASCYVTKPLELDDFAEVVRTIDSFWLSRVTLPPGGRYVASGDDRPLPPGPAPAPWPGRLAVLLVEDSAADAHLVRYALGSGDAPPFSITHARRLEEALDHLRRGPYDAVLLDLSLPDSQGLDTFTTLQAAVPHLPVILLSGNDDDETALETVAAGAQDYLVKGPLEPRVLGRTIRYAVERKRLEREMATVVARLEDALNRVKVLDGLLPICAGCKKIRDDRGGWTQLESYISAHSDAVFSHGLCPDCAAAFDQDVPPTPTPPDAHRT